MKSIRHRNKIYRGCHYLKLPDGLQLCVARLGAEVYSTLVVGVYFEDLDDFHYHNPYGPAVITNPWSIEELVEKMRKAIAENKIMSAPGSMFYLFGISVPAFLFSKPRKTKELLSDVLAHVDRASHDRVFSLGRELTHSLDDDYRSFFKTIEACRELVK